MFFPHYVLKDVFAIFSLVNFLVLHMTGNSNIILCLNIIKKKKKIWLLSHYKVFIIGFLRLECFSSLQNVTGWFFFVFFLTLIQSLYSLYVLILWDVKCRFV